MYRQMYETLGSHITACHTPVTVTVTVTASKLIVARPCNTKARIKSIKAKTLPSAGPKCGSQTNKGHTHHRLRLCSPATSTFRNSTPILVPHRRLGGCIGSSCAMRLLNWVEGCGTRTTRHHEPDTSGLRQQVVVC